VCACSVSYLCFGTRCLCHAVVMEGVVAKSF
jgi:hypothetical protein